MSEREEALRRFPPAEAQKLAPQTTPHPYKEYTPKPAWQMTREEYYEPVTLPEGWKNKGYNPIIEKVRGKRGYIAMVITPDGVTLYPADPAGIGWTRAKYEDDHRMKVEEALKQGLPVPAEVLAEYKSPGAVPYINNGDHPAGLPLKLFGSVEDSIIWSDKVGDKTVSVKVKGAQNIKEMHIEGSIALLTRITPYRWLPYAGADSHKEDPEDWSWCKVWWMATFKDGPVTITVDGIRGLSQRELEDAFNNSGALITTGAINQSVPQTKHLYTTVVRRYIDELEKLIRTDQEEFYRKKKMVNDAIKERGRGKINWLPDHSLTDLRQIKKEMDLLYG